MLELGAIVQSIHSLPRGRAKCSLTDTGLSFQKNFPDDRKPSAFNFFSKVSSPMICKIFKKFLFNESLSEIKVNFPHSASAEAAVIVSVKEASGFKSETSVWGCMVTCSVHRNCSLPEFVKYTKYANKKKTLIFYG